MLRSSSFSKFEWQTTQLRKFCRAIPLGKFPTRLLRINLNSDGSFIVMCIRVIADLFADVARTFK